MDRNIRGCRQPSGSYKKTSKGGEHRIQFFLGRCGEKCPSRVGVRLSCSLVVERLVFVDVADNQAERIRQQHAVGNFAAKAIDDIGGPALALLLLLITVSS